MLRERGGIKEAAERAEGADRLLLTTVHNRSFLNSKAGLVLLKITKLSSYRLGFNSFCKKSVEVFFFPLCKPQHLLNKLYQPVL